MRHDLALLRRLPAKVITMQGNELNAYIAWAFNSPRVWKEFKWQVKGKTMAQQEWTIQARVDCGPDEQVAIKVAVQRLARHLLTQISLSPTLRGKVQVVCYSEDFFNGHQDIALIDDTVSEAISGLPDGHQDEGVSRDLLDAVRDLQAE